MFFQILLYGKAGISIPILLIGLKYHVKRRVSLEIYRNGII